MNILFSQYATDMFEIFGMPCKKKNDDLLTINRLWIGKSVLRSACIGSSSRLVVCFVFASRVIADQLNDLFRTSLYHTFGIRWVLESRYVFGAHKKSVLGESRTARCPRLTGKRHCSHHAAHTIVRY